eukprot:m.181334 g.181334  ORF g.181334 m.181334 type:complete len:517 (+) comp16627_c5_seq2:112-1662(+)
MKSSIALTATALLLLVLATSSSGQSLPERQQAATIGNTAAGSAISTSSKRIPVEADGWWEGGKIVVNHPAAAFVIIGKHTGYAIKRGLIDVSHDSMSKALHSCQHGIASAHLSLYFMYAHRASGSSEPWVDRDIVVQGLRQTFTQCGSSCKWPETFVKDPAYTDGITTEPVHIPSGTTAQWFKWDITEIAQSWSDNAADIRGLVLYALNEETNGRDLRFASEEQTDRTLFPYIALSCAEEPTTSAQPITETNTFSTPPSTNTADITTAVPTVVSETETRSGFERFVVPIARDAFYEYQPGTASGVLYLDHYSPYSLIGYDYGWPIKRSIVDCKADELVSVLKRCPRVTYAGLSLTFIYAHSASTNAGTIYARRLARDISALGLRKSLDCDENGATSSCSSFRWPSSFIRDDTYVDTSRIIDTVTVTADAPGNTRFEWNITSLALEWQADSSTEHGVVLWATNEATWGRDLRFASLRFQDKDVHPFVVIECDTSEPTPAPTTTTTTTTSSSTFSWWA